MGPVKTTIQRILQLEQLLGITIFHKIGTLTMDNGVTIRISRHYLDNHWIVPYNMYLLTIFDCHINVEICCAIKTVKYLYKYLQGP